MPDEPLVWTCPKCGRALLRMGQEHFCAPIATIDEYIAAQPQELRPLLAKVRETIRAAAPGAMEKIAWRMPTFWQGENLIHFAAAKRHLGIYPGELARLPAGIAARLAPYGTTKGAIQLPYAQPIPYDLIADITRWRVEAATKK